MVNRVTLLGRVGQIPEIRQTQSGQSVSNFSVATNEKWTDKSGEKVEKTEWHRIVVWGKLADVCAQFVTKGMLVYIEGKLQTREYDDKTGVKRFVTEIQAHEVKFLGEKHKEEQEHESDLPF